MRPLAELFNLPNIAIAFLRQDQDGEDGEENTDHDGDEDDDEHFDHDGDDLSFAAI